jgi:hypothetical protein
MTCTGFYINKNDVYAFSDGSAYNGELKREIVEPKFFKVGDIWFAYTSSFRMADIIQYQLIIPQRLSDIDDKTYIKKYVAEEIRSVLKEFGFLRRNGEDEETSGTFLVYYNGVVYHFYNDLQCLLVNNNFHCIGSGEQAMRASFKAVAEDDIKNSLKKCLEITSSIVEGVGEPFFIEKIK